jgi:replication factor C small subunit
MSINEQLTNIWVEKYRPSNLNEMVLSKENREYFESITESIPNLLFVGTPGIGKTTIAKIIVQDILKCQYIYINASDENGIDTIRNKVSNFSQTKSIDGKIKIVILDEADGITIDGQRALRNTMEEYSKYTRFILTANYKHKIIPAIHSRTQYFDLSPDIHEITARLLHILKTEGVKVPTTEKTKLARIIKDCYPDIRKCINTVQKYCITGTFISTVKTDSKEIVEKIHSLLSSRNVLELRKYLIENESEFQSDYANLLKQYLNYIYTSNLPDDKKKQAIVTVSEYLYRNVFVADTEINAFACFVNIELLYHSNKD